MNPPFRSHGASNLINVQVQRNGIIWAKVTQFGKESCPHDRLIPRMTIIDHLLDEVVIINLVIDCKLIESILFDARNVFCKRFIGTLLRLGARNTIVVQAM